MEKKFQPLIEENRIKCEEIKNLKENLEFFANKNSSFVKEITQKNEIIENFNQEKLKNNDFVYRLNNLNKEILEKDQIINELKSRKNNNYNNTSNKFN